MILQAAISMKAELRDKTGRGTSREARRNERIPGVIYGGSKEPLHIEIDRNKLNTVYRQGGFSSQVVDLDLGKEKIRVIPREVQMHPVSDLPIHADFLRIEEGRQINVMVKVNFINIDKAPGIKRGGVLNIVRRRIELICPADKIPAVLTADLAGLGIGHSLHIDKIALPEGVETAIRGRNFTIATITGRAAKDDTVEAVAVDAAAVPATAQAAPAAGAAAGGKAPAAKAPAAKAPAKDKK